MWIETTITAATTTTNFCVTLLLLLYESGIECILNVAVIVCACVYFVRIKNFGAVAVHSAGVELREIDR